MYIQDIKFDLTQLNGVKYCATKCNKQVHKMISRCLDLDYNLTLRLRILRFNTLNNSLRALGDLPFSLEDFCEILI